MSKIEMNKAVARRTQVPMKKEQTLRSLTNELKLIEYWDIEYYKRTDRTPMEIEAYKIRQYRKRQIVAAIVKLEELLEADNHADC